MTKIQLCETEGGIKLDLGAHANNPALRKLRWEKLLHELQGCLGYTVKLHLKQSKTTTVAKRNNWRDGSSDKALVD